MRGDVKAIVMAGGSRCSWHAVLPPSLYPIIHRPLIWHILRWLAEGGVAEATICADREMHLLMECLDDGSDAGVRLDYYQNELPRGSAGCVRDAASESGAKRFVVVEGSCIPRFELSGLLEGHGRAEALLTFVLSRDGDSVGRGFISSGIYVLEREAFNEVPEAGCCGIEESLIPGLQACGARVEADMRERPCLTVGNAQSYLFANAHLLECGWHLNLPEAEYARHLQSRVHRTATCPLGTRLLGPVLIGPATFLADGVTVAGPAVIGANCHLGRGAVVSRSVLWDECTIGPNASVDMCVFTGETGVEPFEKVEHRVQVTPRPRNFVAPDASRARSTVFQTSGIRS